MHVSFMKNDAGCFDRESVEIKYRFLEIMCIVQHRRKQLSEFRFIMKLDSTTTVNHNDQSNETVSTDQTLYKKVFL